MAVHQLSETPIREPLRLVATHEDDAPEPKSPPRDDAREARNVAVLVQATATLNALARIVSARLILLLSVIGAFALALFVIDRPTWQALAVLGFYVLVVMALVALESGVLARLRSSQ